MWKKLSNLKNNLKKAVAQKGRGSSSDDSEGGSFTKEEYAHIREMLKHPGDRRSSGE